MATRHALRHRTTGWFLACRPDLNPDGHYVESSDETDAVSWSTMMEAAYIAVDCFPDFADAWEIVPITVALNSEGGLHVPEDVTP